MKKIFLLIIIIMISISIFANYDAEWYEENELCVKFSNFGVFGYDLSTGDPGGYWPSDYPSENYIYGAGIWVGALIDTNSGLFDTLVTCGYRPGSGISEFVPGFDASVSRIYDDPEVRVYLSGEENGGFLWPIRTINNKDSIFSHNDLYAFFNDKDTFQHFFAENKPLDIEVKMYVYSWKNPFMENTLFIRYTIKNARTDGKTLENVFFGLNIDNDIGNEAGTSANDLLGFIDTITTDYWNISDTLIRMNTVYQFQQDSETGWHDFPGIITYTVLESPEAKENIDLYGDGDFIINQGDEVGLTSFTQYTLQTDPVNKIERYLTMAGYDIVNFDPSDPQASYEPFPNWGQGTSGYPGKTMYSGNAGDQRFSMSSGYFDLLPGESKDFVIAVYINKQAEDIVPTASRLIHFWKNRDEMIGNRLHFYKPAEDTTISDIYSVIWQCDTVMDSFYIYVMNKYEDTLLFEKGENTFSYDLDPSLLPDGIYRMYVCNYDSFYATMFTEFREIIIDNPNENCTPKLISFNKEINGDTVDFYWSAIDPDNSELNYTLEIKNDNTDLIYSLTDTTYSVDAYKLLPNGDYDVTLIVEDDSLAADTLFNNLTINIYRSGDDITNLVSGNSNLIKIRALTYDKDSIVHHSYDVIFDNPIYYDYNDIRLPYIVYDKFTFLNMVVDTVKIDLNNDNDVYYSPIFNGIGLEFTKNNIADPQYDSIKVTNDIGTPYVDSILNCESYSSTFWLGGRDLILYWHELNDSLYADIIIDEYLDTLYYDSVQGFNYFYGTQSNCSDYIFANTVTRASMYIPGGYIYFNKPGAFPIAMDTTMAPEEGEIWRLYASGGRLPIKGDVYTFTPTGIKNKIIEYKSGFFLKHNIVNKQLIMNITGNNEEYEINVYDLQGRYISNIYNGKVSGIKEINKRLDLPNGVYFIKDTKHSNIKPIKMILLQ